MDDRLLTVRQVATFLQISEHTIRHWIWQQTGLGRLAIRVGRSVRFKPSDIEKYLEGHRVVGEGMDLDLEDY